MRNVGASLRVDSTRLALDASGVGQVSGLESRDLDSPCPTLRTCPSSESLLLVLVGGPACRSRESCPPAMAGPTPPLADAPQLAVDDHLITARLRRRPPRRVCSTSSRAERVGHRDGARRRGEPVVVSKSKDTVVRITTPAGGPGLVGGAAKVVVLRRLVVGHRHGQGVGHGQRRDAVRPGGRRHEDGAGVDR